MEASVPGIYSDPPGLLLRAEHRPNPTLSPSTNILYAFAVMSLVAFTKSLSRLCLFISVLFPCRSLSQTNVVRVSGMSNPYLAGMPDGSVASSGDTAPAQSPAQVLGFPVTPRSVVRFTASGAVRWNPNQPYYDPEGQLDLNTAHLDGPQNGISDVVMPANALLGIFLGPGRPDTTGPPASLDFSTEANRDYLTLSPQLKQVFFIGNGRVAGGNVLQRVIVPAGATRLFLGTMDGRRWLTNDGEFIVEVSAEASLTFQRTATNLLLNWPTSAANYNLYTATNLSPSTTWQRITNVSVVNGRLTATNELSAPMQFFRLAAP